MPPMTANKMPPDVRAEYILTAAVDVASSTSVRDLTREAVAVHAGVSPALVSLRMGTMPQLRRKVFRAAVQRRILSLVAEGITARETACIKAPDDLKRAALAHLLK